MRKIKTLFTLILTLSMLLASSSLVFAKTDTTSKVPDKNKKIEEATKDWNWYSPGETKTIEVCQSMEDEKNDWAYIEGTESFYDADFVITEYYVDPEGDDKTVYEIFATLDNSNRDKKISNTWITADGVIDLETMTDVRNDKSYDIDYVKEKDQKGTDVFYHYVITAPNDLKLAFFFNGGVEEEHKEVKLIGNLYTGLSKGINDDTCVVMKLCPDDEKYPSDKKVEEKKETKKSDSSKKSFSIRNDKYGEDKKITVLEYKYDSKNKKVKGSENFFDATMRAYGYKSQKNDDGSMDFFIDCKLNAKNHDKNSRGLGFNYGVIETDPLSVPESSSGITLGMGKHTEGDTFFFNYKVHVPKDKLGNVAIYFTTQLPEDYEDVDQIAKLPKDLSRAFWDKDIFYLVLDPNLKDYSEK